MLFATALLLSSLLAPTPAPWHVAQDGPHTELVREQLATAPEGADLSTLWTRAAALRAAAGEDEAGLDRALDAVLGSTGELAPRAALLAASARLAGDEPDLAVIAKRLAPVLASADAPAARAAAGMLADARFRGLAEAPLEVVLKSLEDCAEDGDRDPLVRVEASLALHALGRPAEQRAARAAMLSFLGSSDPELAAEGALALARAGDVETGRAELERLAAAPGPRGQLATAYLKQEELRRFYDRRQKNLLDYAREQSKDAELKGNHEQRLLEQVMRLIEQAALEGENVKRSELVDAALDGMLRSLDEHSSYLSSDVYKKNFAEDLLEPVYGGIGAYVGEDPDDKLFTIRQPIYSGPAYRAGLQSDDKVVRIDDWPTFNSQGSKPLDEIIKRLKGKPGTPVTLYIWRRGMDQGLIERPTEDMAVTITREEVTIPPVKAELLPGGVAHLQLDTFSQVAHDELAKAIKSFEPRGLKAIVLDLRQNTGGLLPQARDVANLFLPKRKLVVTTESRLGDPRRHYTTEDALVPAEVPVVVLVGRYSASASEIVAGALQDHGRALVVGERTFGKGSVQELLPIPGEQDDVYEDENKNGRADPWEPLTKDFNGNGSFDFAPRARLTVARYLLPSGRSIHREFEEDGRIKSPGGVEPDREAKPRRLAPETAEEMGRILRARSVRAWVDGQWPKHKDRLLELAKCDYDDPQRYPEFDALYASLATTLSQQDVRRLLRREVRARAQDAQGAAFPDGDFEDDAMLQAAIAAALQGLGTDTALVPEYAATFQEAPREGGGPAVASARLTSEQRDQLRHALSLIGEARSGSKISEQGLEEIQRALSGLLDG